MWDISRKTIEKYCEKNNTPLEVITEKKYEIKNTTGVYNYTHLEKNQVYDLFEKYERILRVDWDVIISPHCPNLFEIVPEDKIGVIFEDVGPKRGNRLSRIRLLQEVFGDIGWRSGYFNSGVILASKQHRSLFLLKEEDIKEIENLKTEVSKEQSYLNYRVRKIGLDIYELGYKFNHTRNFSKNWNGNPPRHESYIIHYAGSKKQGLKNMRIDYGILFENKKPVESMNKIRNKEDLFQKNEIKKEYLTKKRFPFFKLAGKYLPINNESIVVDIGAGDGLFADYLHLKKKYDNLYLLDGNRLAVDKLKKKFKNVILYNARDSLPFEVNSVDILHCGTLIEHLDYIELYHFFH